MTPEQNPPDPNHRIITEPEAAKIRGVSARYFEAQFRSLVASRGGYRYRRAASAIGSMKS